MKLCIYPGSFDPFTNGHLDIMLRASNIFDKVIVGVLNNINKRTIFSVEERIDFINLAAKEKCINNVCAKSFEGLLVDFAKQEKADYIVRGIRSAIDFEYEMQMNAINKKLNSNIDILFLPTNREFAFLSSSVVKEVAKFGGDISRFLPKSYYKTVLNKILEMKG